MLIDRLVDAVKDALIHMNLPNDTTLRFLNTILIATDVEEAKKDEESIQQIGTTSVPTENTEHRLDYRKPRSPKSSKAVHHQMPTVRQ